MIPALSIRPLHAADLAVAARLHLDAFGSEAWDQRALRDIFAMHGTRGIAAFGSSEPRQNEPAIETLLGFLLYQVVALDAELLTVAVARGARRRGVATELLTACLIATAAAGAANLLLEVADDNYSAQRLYSRFGFTMVGQRKNYYRRPGNKHVAAHLLRRSLHSPATK